VKRTCQVHNFKTCRKTAILFEASRTEDFDAVREFMKFLTSLSIDTELIGFVNADDVQGNLLFRDKCHFFCNKDLNLFYIPKTDIVRGFLKDKYDILFDLTLNDSFPLRYLATLSLSDFKVGRYQDDDNKLDLMIDIRKEPDIGYLIDQIKNYVSRLNNPETVA
jgi:hypothetical protein